MKKTIVVFYICLVLSALIVAEVYLMSFGTKSAGDTGTSAWANLIEDALGDGNPAGSATFIIFKSDSTYYARNGTDGTIDYSGTSFPTVINAAIAALGTGGRILIKAGVYDVTSTINLTSTSTVELLGEGKGFGATQRVTYLNGTSGVNVITISTGTFHRIADMEIHGGDHGIYSTSTQDVLFENLALTNQENHGIYMNTVKHSIIQKCWIEYSAKDAINVGEDGYVNKGQIKILNNHITNWGEYGLQLVGPETPRATHVAFNNFYIGATGSYDAILLYGAKDCNIVYNGFGGIVANETGIRLANHASYGTVDRVNIIGNVFSYFDTETMKYCIESNHATGRVNLIANIFNDYVTAPVNFTAGSDIKYRDNIGLVTENSGSDSIANGTTSKQVAHGLGVTPSEEHFTIIGKEDPTNSVGTIWISGIDATNFTVNVENDPGASNWDFGWKVRID